MPAIEENLSQLRSVRNDIWRCRKLLQADLSDAERTIIQKRLVEQRKMFDVLIASTFPLTLTL
jgi:hypothetical protein